MTRIQFSRRDFIAQTLKTAGVVVVSSGIAASLTACSGASIRGRFDYGVASGDPLQDRVIIWTRITPIEQLTKQNSSEVVPIWAAWQVATDANFKNIVVADGASTDASRDYTLKVDVRGLKAGKTYYYRFITASHTSPVGRTKTLPKGTTQQVKLAVVSCSNYPAGLFHVYKELAERSDLDAIVHLGDYIYEYPQGGYASEDAAALGREVLPANELIALQDYRTRYAQYRTDPELQAAHQAHPFITVWDDHEVANDTWREGAENHTANEGNFIVRLKAAIQAYAEWMPIRPAVNNNIAALQRSFQFGDLVNLIMLDTRIVGRDKQLDLANYFTASGFNAPAFIGDISNPARRLIGAEQLTWLEGQLHNSAQTWQVLGQQIIMGVMELPAAIVTQQLSIAEFAQLAQLAQIAATQPELLSPAQLVQLQQKGPLLRLGNLPYNLDAWDGYPVERANVLASALEANSNFVVLSGDTHNAWANNLTLGGIAAGVEFATPGVTSPGLETYLGLNTQEAILQAEAAVTQLIPGLQYTNLCNRGYMTVTFTPAEVNCEWVFLDTVKSPLYSVDTSRSKTIRVAVNTNTIGA